MKYLLVALSASLLLFSCKKELRTKTYQLNAFNSSGMSGTLSFVERDDDKTTVRLEAQGLLNNTVYLTHLHAGTLDGLAGTILNFTEVQTATGSITKEKEWDIKYDDALNSNTCFTIHDPNHFANDYSSYFLGANTGKNGN